MSDSNNGIDAILAKINEYAEETAKKIIDDSTEKVNAAYEKAMADAAEYSAELSGQSETELSLLESRAAADYETVVRDRTLALKQELLSKTYQRAVELLKGLPDERKLELYKKWLLRFGEDKNYTVILNKEDKEAFYDILSYEISKGVYPGKPVLSAETADISGGMILDCGDTRTDISFENAVSAEKGKYDGELIGILFAEDSK